MAKEQITIHAGKRKTAIARVRIKYGTGQIVVNGRDVTEYFSGRKSILQTLRMPLVVTSAEGKYDVVANIQGGGPRAQADALRHGIAKALLEQDAENRSALKKNGFLTRDDRMVERKKYGHKGARKSFQFSKR